METGCLDIFSIDISKFQLMLTEHNKYSVAVDVRPSVNGKQRSVLVNFDSSSVLLYLTTTSQECN